VRQLYGRLLGFAGRAISVGVLASDGAEVRLRKSGLLLTVWSITVLANVWVLVYLALGRPVSAAIPLAYQVVSLLSIAWIARFGWTAWFRASQLIIMLLLPALLMWSLGGFTSGSAVIIWSFLAPMGALVFSTKRQATIVMGAFAALVLISGILDPWLSTHVEPLPQSIIGLFYVLNIVAVGSVAFGGTVYFVHLRDQAQAQLAQVNRALDVERARSDSLLRNILPDAVAERLKNGEAVSDRYEAVTVVFADIVGFTPMAADLPAEELVSVLGRIYGALDDLVAEHGLVRIKTIGDAYMAAAGVPDVMPPQDGAMAAARMALAMFEQIALEAPGVRVRVGMHTGPAVAGVIGRRTFAYDVWGDAVNVASRMESQGLPDHVQVSAATCALIERDIPCSYRGQIEIKGRGLMDTYLIVRPVASLL
jgi:adenylate cyclase